ncbi:hypothetical protein [Paenibacillus herberti]|uniref:Uncharacterized protein n=1 Tax=Paenibacillus herberti TaxID=1619309 RepID=A0A229P291_9BACL|nr:hypothetical protein [Paenibacillus herberti]OXM16074.1 hypothetical protein CGZ75_05060 [Paenibacillus herberti]
MDYEQVQISNFQGSKVGVILILFILLVIITCAFPTGQRNNCRNNVPDFVPDFVPDDDSNILATRTFNIINNTTSRTFVFISSSRPEVTPTPSAVMSPGGGFNQYELRVVESGVYRVTIRYDVRNVNGASVGSFQFRLNTRRSGLGGISTSIDEVSTTATGINWSINGTTLTITQLGATIDPVEYPCEDYRGCNQILC